MKPEGYFTVNDNGMWEENKSGVGVPLFSSNLPVTLSPNDIEKLYDKSLELIDYCQDNRTVFIKTMDLLLKHLNS